jgi:hypothetical protein
MATNSTSLNACVDFFFMAGALRKEDNTNRILGIFSKAYNEDRETAIKLLFWLRDARSGAGEKKTFLTCFKYLLEKEKDTAIKLIDVIPEFGYYKDLSKLFDEINNDDFKKGIVDKFSKDINQKNGLSAKWIPRNSKLFKAIWKHRGSNPKEFRKLIVELSKTVEQQMSSKNWDKINYSHVPSRAMLLYRNSFLKQDKERFESYIQSLKKGDDPKVKINSGVLYPHELFQAITREGFKETLIEQWKSLPNYLENSSEKILPICDVSESMSGLPMAVSISLGIYISERTLGKFKDSFITFSGKPQLQVLKGDLLDKFRQMREAIGYNTNLNATFDMLLNKAKEINAPYEDMPTTLLVISDMEFDDSNIDYNETALEMIERKYTESGYLMPKLIFWNVASRHNNVPASVKSKNVGLVSGFSPSILKAILSGSDFSPKGIMLNTVNSDRYKILNDYIR